MTEITIALFEETKRLQARIDELMFDLTQMFGKIEATKAKAVLYAKKAQVMAKIDRVKETGKHQQGWRYATSEDVKDAVRVAMAEAGLSLSFELVSHEIERTDNRVVVTGVVAYTLECSETGATETKAFAAEAVDYGRNVSAEKTFYKLYTTSEKYFLKTTFLVASGDELDSDGDAPPSDSKSPGKKQIIGKKSPVVPDPWRPTKEEFFEKALEKFPGMTNQDLVDELKEGGFTGYKVDKAPEMMMALEKRIKKSE